MGLDRDSCFGGWCAHPLEVDQCSQPKCGSVAETHDTTHSPRRYGQIYCSHNGVRCRDLGGLSRHCWECLREQRKTTGLAFCVGHRVGMGWGRPRLSQGVLCLNVMLVPKEEEPGLSYHPSQRWGKRGRKEKWWGSKAVSSQTSKVGWSQTLYYKGIKWEFKTSLYLLTIPIKSLASQTVPFTDSCPLQTTKWHYNIVWKAISKSVIIITEKEQEQLAHLFDYIYSIYIYLNV